jgi:hypothetical protein
MHPWSPEPCGKMGFRRIRKDPLVAVPRVRCIVERIGRLEWLGRFAGRAMFLMSILPWFVCCPGRATPGGGVVLCLGWIADILSFPTHFSVPDLSAYWLSYSHFSFDPSVELFWWCSLSRHHPCQRIGAYSCYCGSGLFVWLLSAIWACALFDILAGKPDYIKENLRFSFTSSFDL